MEDTEIITNDLFTRVFRNRKVLITGDTGFKGSWLAIWLDMLGADVYGFALPPNNDVGNYQLANVKSRIVHEDGDIRDVGHLIDFFEKVKPEFVFHLAAQPFVLESYKDPVYTFETNLMGVVNLLEAVKNSNSVKVALNITSDKCYSNIEQVSGYKENDPLGGNDPYSASKAGSELITHSYLKSFFSQEATANVATVRAGNVIGAGDWGEHRIVPDFFRSLEKGEDLVIRNPEAIRPWQHVLEPLSGYLLLAYKLFVSGKQFSGAWNFGPRIDSQCSVKVLINEIIRFTGEGGWIQYDRSSKPYEAMTLKLDISKAQQFLQWCPTLSFEETVQFTVDGYKNDLSGEDAYRSRVKQILCFTRLTKERNNFFAYI